jgi:hypothetical protein
MGSGSFSLKVGGPRMAPGRSDGVPDPDWAIKVIKLLEEQQTERLITEATEHQMLKAGNVGGDFSIGSPCRCNRQPEAGLCRAADAERSRLWRVAVELSGQLTGAAQNIG